MPATSPSGISYPGVDDLFNYHVDLAGMASSIQAAFDKQANLFRGTGAQRNAFLTDAPEGVFWSDNDGSKVLHQKRNGLWWPEMQSHNVHAISPNFATSSNGLVISNFGRVAHLSVHFYQIQTFLWGSKQTIQLGTFDDKWAPPPGGLTLTLPMSSGYDNSSTGNPWIRQDLIVGKRDDDLPVFDSRIMVYNPGPQWGNTYTTAERRAGLSFSVSWPLPY